ncbi:MAG TPA: hypothetical protein PKH51_04930, partial [Candidatus Sumerlaeota bacterium]|nr:hypothetical protein [Candidatus Sumerlaeota bacterium]
MKRLSTIVCLLGMSLPLAVSADVLILTDGTQLEGRAEAVVGSDDRVAFTSGTGRIELPKSRIAEIKQESDSADYTRIGDQYLKAKNYPAAVQKYQKAIEFDAAYEPAQKGLKEAQGAITAEQNERVKALQEKIGQQLETIPALIKSEKYEDADAALKQITESEATEQQRLTAQRYFRDLYLAWAFSRYDRLDYRGAEEKYLRVMEMDPENKDARDALLKIWINDPLKKQEVLKAYLAKLAEEPNNLEYNQIAGDLLYETERYGEAIGPLTKIYDNPRYANRGYSTKLRNAYKQYILQQYDDKNLDGAIATYKTMLSIFTDEDDTNLRVYTYERDKAKLADTDYNGRAMLAKRLQDDGLTQLATREAELILRSDPNNKVADDILRKETETEFARIQEAMAARNFLVARDLSMKFMNTQTRYPKLVESAQEIFNKADIEAKRMEKASREQARTLAERGIEYYNEALRNTDQMSNTERRQNTHPVSYKNEAVKYAQRAIDHFETALRIDPTLGPITGMDLNARLRDAQELYNNLTDKPTRLPTYTRRRGSSRQ